MTTDDDVGRAGGIAGVVKTELGLGWPGVGVTPGGRVCRICVVGRPATGSIVMTSTMVLPSLKEDRQ